MHSFRLYHALIPIFSLSPPLSSPSDNAVADEKLARAFGSMDTHASEEGSDAGDEQDLLDSVAEVEEAEAQKSEVRSEKK